MVRVAMLSFWHVHAYEYAKKFNDHPNAELTVVWDEDCERGKKFAEEFNIPFEPNLEAVLHREDVDAVCVTAPTSMHKDLMVAAAKGKKHIFTEKVLSFTNEDAQEIKNAVVSNGIRFVISLPHRTNPENLFAKEVIERKLLGEITLIRVRNAHNGAGRDWLPPFFYDKALCGGGAMVDLGAHPMYLIHWLMGRPSAVTSTFTNVTGKDVEDNAVSVFQYPNGAIAISETSFVSEASPHMLELHGTEGCLLVGKDGVQIHSTKIHGDYTGWVQPDKLPERLPSAIDQFIDSILNNGKIYFTIEDAVSLTELMVSAYKASKNGVSVRF